MTETFKELTCWKCMNRQLYVNTVRITGMKNKLLFASYLSELIRESHV